jgi:hypothetical protein
VIRQKSMIPRRKKSTCKEHSYAVSSCELIDWDNRKAARDRRRRHVMTKAEFQAKMTSFFLNK